MIKGIYSGGRYVQVNNGSPSWPSIYNNNYGGPPNGSQSFSGQVRYSSQSGSMEIFDGNTWQQLGNSVAQVGLNPEAERILDWARQKMDEEALLITRMQKHPGLRDAYEKFKIMDILTLEEEKAGTEQSAGLQVSP